MKIEATAAQIRALLSLAACDEAAGDSPASEAEAARHGLLPLMLERYDALVAAGREPAIVPIERGACSGCHLRLPTMVESKATRELALYTCPHCRRMLFARALLQPDSRAARERAPGRKRRTAAEVRPS